MSRQSKDERYLKTLGFYGGKNNRATIVSTFYPMLHIIDEWIVELRDEETSVDRQNWIRNQMAIGICNRWATQVQFKKWDYFATKESIREALDCESNRRALMLADDLTNGRIDYFHAKTNVGRQTKLTNHGVWFNDVQELTANSQMTENKLRALTNEMYRLEGYVECIQSFITERRSHVDEYELYRCIRDQVTLDDTLLQKHSKVLKRVQDAKKLENLEGGMVECRAYDFRIMVQHSKECRQANVRTELIPQTGLEMNMWNACGKDHELARHTRIVDKDRDDGMLVITYEADGVDDELHYKPEDDSGALLRISEGYSNTFHTNCYEASNHPRFPVYAQVSYKCKVIVKAQEWTCAGAGYLRRSIMDECPGLECYHGISVVLRKEAIRYQNVVDNRILKVLEVAIDRYDGCVLELELEDEQLGKCRANGKDETIRTEWLTRDLSEISMD